MEQTALRPKPMPGREPGGGTGSSPARRPHAARRRGRRLTTLLFGLFIGTVLVPSG
ncbi:PDZ domain-containing protein, partial [Streptomyces sp. PSKA30]|nr:PDZ domain-containing protein [Streptomyces sp. PSKA30]